MTENQVEDCIIKDPAALGYPDALIVRNARMSRSTGRVDLMILPTTGKTRLALVEVKRAASYDAASKVIGQLIMYYAAALKIGLDGLERIRQFAAMHREAAQSPNNTSLNVLAGGAPSQEVGWRLLQEGRKLKPGEIDLFLALDGNPPPKLIDSLHLLKNHHDLTIRVAIATGDAVRLGPAA
jgi:hypothetical protein